MNSTPLLWSQNGWIPQTLFILHGLIEVALIVRIMLRPNRDAPARIAWIVIITALPIFGIMAYTLFGEVHVGRRRMRQMKKAQESLAAVNADIKTEAAPLPNRYRHLFQLGKSINGFAPVSGNAAILFSDSNQCIDAIVDDINHAVKQVLLLFYIWLPDKNGNKVIEAILRASQRGIDCSVLVDGVGSRTLIHSSHWKAMKTQGIKLAEALPVANPLLRPFSGRIDVRNHRKAVVIDGAICYCGSQNCADPEFLSKAKFAPWVDLMVRFEGPIAWQEHHLFAADWLASNQEEMSSYIAPPKAFAQSGVTAQVIGTGPTLAYPAIAEIFNALIHSARNELIISTPYYVPNEALQSALCVSARQGTDVTLIVPAKNDSHFVSGASKSYYANLLKAGVAIHEYNSGLLHAKSITVDGEIAMIGSANMDRRSFDLNFENNVLLYDPTLTSEIRELQQHYILQSTEVTLEQVNAWPMVKKLYYNTLSILSPIL